MFSSFIRVPSGGRGGEVVRVGSHLSLAIRSNGGTGWVLVLGLFRKADGSYPSRKSPMQVGCRFTTHKGAVSEETLTVTDSDGVHLADSSLAEVKALIASLKDVVVLSLS